VDGVENFFWDIVNIPYDVTVTATVDISLEECPVIDQCF
jgi:hypothetical protein